MRIVTVASGMFGLASSTVAASAAAGGLSALLSDGLATEGWKLLMTVLALAFLGVQVAILLNMVKARAARPLSHGQVAGTPRA